MARKYRKACQFCVNQIDVNENKRNLVFDCQIDK